MFSLMCGLKLWFVNRASDKMAAKKTKKSEFKVHPDTGYDLHIKKTFTSDSETIYFGIKNIKISLDIEKWKSA